VCNLYNLALGSRFGYLFESVATSGPVERLWPWSRMTDWRAVHAVMEAARLDGPHASASPCSVAGLQGRDGHFRATLRLGEAAMSTTTATDLAEHVIATLRAHEAELRQAGIRRLSLFGSVARGDAEADSDVDLAAEFDPAAEMGLIRLVALERRIEETLGRPVEILPEPVESPRLRASVERDRLIAF